MGGLLLVLGVGVAPAGARVALQGCTIDERFLGFGESEAPLVGSCTTAVSAVREGKTIWQGTTTGVLFSQRRSDSVYFFADERALVLVDGRFVVLYGPGQR
jgi:hypothetical protein